jgi:hypothetical protein
LRRHLLTIFKGHYLTRKKGSGNISNPRIQRGDLIQKAYMLKKVSAWYSTWDCGKDGLFPPRSPYPRPSASSHLRNSTGCPAKIVHSSRNFKHHIDKELFFRIIYLGHDSPYALECLQFFNFPLII